jgi:hypothetical protein
MSTHLVVGKLAELNSGLTKQDPASLERRFQLALGVCSEGKIVIAGS